MITLLEALNQVDDYAYNKYVRILDAAPRAYKRAITALRSLPLRHPMNQTANVRPRDGQRPIDGAIPVNFIIASPKGTFSMRGYEIRIPSLMKDGELFIDEREEFATLLATSSHRGNEGYIYVYPLPLEAALWPVREALEFISGAYAARQGVIPAAHDEQGWIYPGEHEKEFVELAEWYFHFAVEKFNLGLKDKTPYVAFTTDPEEEGNRHSILGYRLKMLVLGERVREASPAPWDNAHVFPERKHPESLYEALNEVIHRDTYVMLDSMAVASEGEDLASDIKSFLRNEAKKEIFKIYFTKYADFTLDRGVRMATTIRFIFHNDFGDIDAEVWRGDKTHFLPEPLAKGLLRAMLVKKGIQQACAAGLVTVDERDGKPAPLNERELPYEEYLRIGVEWIEGLLSEAQMRPEDLLPHPDEDPERNEPLAEWERILIEGDDE